MGGRIRRSHSVGVRFCSIQGQGLCSFLVVHSVLLHQFVIHKFDTSVNYLLVFRSSRTE